MDRPRRILFFHFGGGIGGAPVSMLQTAAALDRDRFDPVVAFSEDGPVLAFARELGVPTRVAPMKSAFFYSTLAPFRASMALRYLWRYRASVRAARRVIDQEAPDLVHLNTSVLLPVAAAARDAGVPVVWHLREPVGPNPLLRRFMVDRVRTGADHIVATTEHVARDYRGDVSVTVIHNALDEGRFTPRGDEVRARIRDDLGIHPADVVVGIIGAVQSIKGHFFLLDAAPRLVEEEPRIRFLVIAGETGGAHPASLKGLAKGLLGRPKDQMARMQKQVRHLGLQDHFIFTGFRSDIPEMLSAMDVLMFPSLVAEGFGRPLIEGMAMGTPVVATDIGPTKDLVGTDAALLVAPGDVDGLTAALLAVTRQPELRASLARAGRAAFVKNFTMTRLQEDLSAVYEGVLSKP